MDAGGLLMHVVYVDLMDASQGGPESLVKRMKKIARRLRRYVYFTHVRDHRGRVSWVRVTWLEGSSATRELDFKWGSP